MNSLGLLLLVLLVLFITQTDSKKCGCENMCGKVCHCGDNCKCGDNCICKRKENFELDKTPMISHKSFNPNSRSNDYYYDRTGRKGTLFHTLDKTPKYEVKTTPILILPEQRVVKGLELYPEATYTNCQPEYDYNKLIEPVYNNDPLNVRLSFNQGVLYNQKGPQ